MERSSLSHRIFYKAWDSVDSAEHNQEEAIFTGINVTHSPVIFTKDIPIYLIITNINPNPITIHWQSYRKNNDIDLPLCLSNT